MAKTQKAEGASGQGATASDVYQTIADLRGEDLEVHIYGEIENDEVRNEVSALLKTRPWCRLVIGFARAEFFTVDFRNILVIREVASKVRATSYLDMQSVPCKPAAQRATMHPRGLAGLPWSCGATAIVAPGGVGKTPLLAKIAAAFRAEGRKAREIHFGEPRGEYESDYCNLMLDIAFALYYGEDVFVDSFKNPVYDLPGSLSAGGASNALWTTLSDLSGIFDRVGLSMVALINPTTADVRVRENAVESLKSSCCGIITTERGGRWVGYVREIETGDRLEITFHSSRDRFEYGESAVAGHGTRVRGVDSADAEQSSAVAKASVDAVLARMLARITTRP